MLGLHRFWGEGQLYYYFSNSNPGSNYYSTNNPRAPIIIQIIVPAADYYSRNNPKPLLLLFDIFPQEIIASFYYYSKNNCWFRLLF